MTKGRVILAAALVLAAFPAHAFLGEILAAPATLVERAVEARSMADIAKDNEIVLKVNGVMAEYKTIKASTEIYEQRLLVTGLFDDKAIHDGFRKKIEAIPGIRKLYWHAVAMSPRDQEKNKAKLISWDDAVILDGKVGASLIATRAVADVNFRVTVDSYGTVYLLGRARSTEERDLAILKAKETGGVKSVVSYVEVR
jgi:osmotically-inducible protein OsmY